MQPLHHCTCARHLRAPASGGARCAPPRAAPRDPRGPGTGAKLAQSLRSASRFFGYARRLRSAGPRAPGHRPAPLYRVLSLLRAPAWPSCPSCPSSSSS
eukprot:scaffold83598_cov69-Phaeocystis_antarctica.AAC.4